MKAKSKSKDKNQGTIFKDGVAIEQNDKLPELDIPIEKDNEDLDLFLFQISTENILGYFNRGILKPVKYINNRTISDIQTKFENYLVFTKNKYIETKEKQFLLEIVLSKDEKSSLIETDNPDVFLYSKPLPISRAFKIYYDEKEDLNEIQSLIKVGLDSPLIDNHEKIKNFEKVDNIDASNIKDLNINEYHDEINTYDKIMGMFAFMKNTPLYYGHCSNYSDNYFKALNVINKDLGEKFNKNDKSQSTIKSMIKNKSNDEFFNELLNHIYSDKEDIQIFKKILINIQDSFSSDEVRSLKKKKNLIDNTLVDPIKSYKKDENADELIKYCLNIISKHYQGIDELIEVLDTKESKLVSEVIELSEDSLEKNNILKLLSNNDKLRTCFYIAYLQEYGDKKSDSHINLKNTINNDLPEEYAEIVLGIMGIHFGYSAMRQNEIIAIDKKVNYLIKDKSLKNLIPNDVNIKFELDTHLDYQTIESIYLYAFGIKSHANLDYLLLDDIKNNINDFDFDKIDKQYDVKLQDYSDKKYFCIKNK